MRFCMITFRSVTPAQQGEGLLRRAGVNCTLHRTPRWMEAQGCGYSLRIQHSDAAYAAQLLRSNQVSFRKIYLKAESGALEELEL